MIRRVGNEWWFYKKPPLQHDWDSLCPLRSEAPVYWQPILQATSRFIDVEIAVFSGFSNKAKDALPTCFNVQKKTNHSPDAYAF